MCCRMRSINEVVNYFKDNDPDTQMTESTIRRMINEGSIPTIKTGNKYLINLDALLDMLKFSSKDNRGALKIEKIV